MLSTDENWTVEVLGLGLGLGLGFGTVKSTIEDAGAGNPVRSTVEGAGTLRCGAGTLRTRFVASSP
jgi:hypothetical protein